MSNFTDLNMNNIKVYKLAKKSIDPDSIQKSNDYDPNFSIEIHYYDACSVCKAENPLEDMCKTCEQKCLLEYQEWASIGKLIQNHKKIIETH